MILILLKPATRTILELQILYEVDHYKEEEDRRVKITSDATHYVLTLHTLAEDDTVREYARAFGSDRRDQK